MQIRYANYSSNEQDPLMQKSYYAYSAGKSENNNFVNKLGLEKCWAQSYIKQNEYLSVWICLGQSIKKNVNACHVINAHFIVVFHVDIFTVLQYFNFYLKKTYIATLQIVVWCLVLIVYLVYIIKKCASLSLCLAFISVLLVVESVCVCVCVCVCFAHYLILKGYDRFYRHCRTILHIHVVFFW